MSELATPLSRDLSRDRLIAELRSLRPLLENEGVTSVILFGSRARRDNRPDSDIDLMIDVDPVRKFSLIDLAHVAGMIEDHTSLPTSILMRRSLDSDFRKTTEPDEVVVF